MSHLKCWQWVEASIVKRELTEFQRKAVNLICMAQGCGPYDFPRTFKTADWTWGDGVRFVIEPLRLATFDFNGLTALVIGAHEECVRVQISAVNMRNIAVIMHPREPEGGLSQRHPSIEQAVEIFRKGRAA